MTLPLTPVRIKDLGVRVSGSKVGFIVMIYLAMDSKAFVAFMEVSLSSRFLRKSALASSCTRADDCCVRLRRQSVMSSRGFRVYMVLGSVMSRV